LIFTVEFIEVLKAGALNFTRVATPSRTLKNAMTVSYRALPRLHQIIVHIPHYWATYYHDGSGPVTMPKGKYMVWFRDPKDDPRLKGGFPVKRSQVRTLNLSKERFSQLVKEGKIIIRQSVGRRQGKFFTKDAYALWGPWVRNELLKAARREILNTLQPLRSIRSI
jgi:hypothetical protein